MADDRGKTRQSRPPARCGRTGFDVQYLVEKAGITAEQARDLIKRHGNDREVLMRHAKNLA